MDPLSEAAVTLQTAVGLHQDGKVKEAEAAYRRVLFALAGIVRAATR